MPDIDYLISALESARVTLQGMQAQEGDHLREVLKTVEREFRKNCPKVSSYIEQGLMQALSNTEKIYLGSSPPTEVNRGLDDEDDIPF